MLTDFIGVLYQTAAAERLQQTLTPAASALCASLPQTALVGDAFHIVIRGARADCHSRSGRGVAVVAGTLEAPGSIAAGAAALASPEDEASFATWLHHCQGRFSGALVEPALQRLRLMRDAIGHEPLYYIAAEDYVAASTSFKALCALLGKAAEPDDIGIADYLAMTHEDREVSLVRQIRRLPPGHWMDLRPGLPSRPKRYWQLDSHAPPAPRGTAAARLRESVVTAMSAECALAERPALLLSGGLDSSSLGATFHHLPSAPKPLKTYGSRSSAIIGKEAAPDESHYMLALATRYPGMQLKLIQPDAGSLLDEVDAGVRTMGFPHRDLYTHEMRSLLTAAAQDGCNLAITGMGGDMFASARLPAFYAHLMWKRRWQQLHQQARQEFAPDSAPEWLRVIWRHAIKPSLRRPRARLTPRWLFSRQYGLGRKTLPLQPAFARRSRFYARAHQAHVASLPDVRLGLAGADIAVAESGTLAHALEYLAALGRSIGIQISSPLLDRRVIECIYSADAADRRFGPQSRSLIRAAFAEWLPESISTRDSKGNFSVKLFDAVDEQLANAMLAKLTHSPLLQGYINLTALRRQTSKALVKANDPAARFFALLPLFLAASLGSFLSELSRPQK